MCSKLFRLNKCAVREFLTRNSHGETKIVLDPGTRSGLSSRCIFLKDENFKSSCGSIDSRREPAWSGADYNHVAHVGRIDSGVQSEAGSHFGIAWIAQGDCAATNQDRNVRYRNFELVKNSLHVGIDLDIKIAVRLTVASKKFFETQRVTRMVGSDQHRIADGVGNEKTRRSTNAFRNISPSAASVRIIWRRLARSISSSVLASRALAQTRVPPRSRTWRTVSPSVETRITSTRPLSTTKMP